LGPGAEQKCVKFFCSSLVGKNYDFIFFGIVGPSKAIDWGKNGPLSLFFEKISNISLFWKYVGNYTIFFETRVPKTQVL